MAIKTAANHIGKKLKRWRLARKLTLEKVAALLEVTPMTVWRWEHEKAQPHDTQEFHIKRLIEGAAA